MGDVGEFGGEARGAGRIDLPAESGLEQEAVGGRRKERRAGELELQVSVDFDERLVAGSDDAAIDDGGLVGCGARHGTGFRRGEVVGLELDGLAFEFLQEGVLVDDAGVVVLLGDLEGDLAGGVAEDDGVGFELAGDVGGGDFVEAGLEVEVDGGAGDGEVLVVDGEGDRGGAALLGWGGEGESYAG